MQLQPHQHYHLYNRSNNNEVVFKEPENYRYFLEKYRDYLHDDLNTIAYCLMPTHFHFLVEVCSDRIRFIQDRIGTLLSSYTKAINKRYHRHGSLFQEHTKAKHIEDDRYLVTTIAYIHQNALIAGLVEHLEDWEYSSYLDYTERRKNPPLLIVKNLVRSHFSSVKEFEEFSKAMLLDDDQLQSVFDGKDIV